MVTAASGDPTDVVVGAGSGMGAAAAAQLAGSGRRLILADRNVNAAKSVAAKFTGDVHAIACDITNESDVRELIGLVGVLGRGIITAGLSPTMANGRTVLEVNLVAIARLVAAMETIVASGSACVVFASSAAYHLPVDPTVDALLDKPMAPESVAGLAAMGLLDHSGIAYAVSKRGVVRLVERESERWGAVGGRLVSVSPGIIDTPMGRLEDAHEPAMADMVKASALGRRGRAEEVASVAVFLASEGASFVTGTDVLVDGGVIANVRKGTG